MNETETSVGKDHLWATVKRVIPRDVYNEFIRFEQLVAENAGLNPRFQAIGPAVEVWSVLMQHLRNTEEELKLLAKEWGKDD